MHGETESFWWSYESEESWKACIEDIRVGLQQYGMEILKRLSTPTPEFLMRVEGYRRIWKEYPELLRLGNEKWSLEEYLGNLTDPLTQNRYSYVKNNPVNYVDPSGHRLQTPVQRASTSKKGSNKKTGSVKTSRSSSTSSKPASSKKGAAITTAKTVTKAPAPVKEPVKASNGLYYQSNAKHTLGQMGNKLSAGIEPSNSLELFENSIESPVRPDVRFAYDELTGTLYRFLMMVMGFGIGVVLQIKVVIL